MEKEDEKEDEKHVFDFAKITLSKLVRRNLIMEIAEVIAPYFRSKKKDASGQSARFISVKDIQFNKIRKNNTDEYDVFVQLLSDQGSWTENIIIKEFSDNTSFQQEMTRYGELEIRFSQVPYVKLLPLIHIDKQNFRIVYEKQNGFDIDQLGLSQELTDFTLGQLTALLHGPKISRLDQTTSQLFVDFLLNHLPFQDEERGSIKKLLQPHWELLAKSGGGYIPFTFYDPKKFQFIPMRDKGSITKNAIRYHGAIQSLITIEDPDYPVADRMADISVIFCKQAYEEFLLNDEVEDTIRCISDFLDGYDEIAAKIKAPPLKDMYPRGSTLNLQMLINFLLIEINKLHGTPDPTGLKNKDAIRYVYMLLVNKPFDF